MGPATKVISPYHIEGAYSSTSLGSSSIGLLRPSIEKDGLNKSHSASPDPINLLDLITNVNLSKPPSKTKPGSGYVIDEQTKAHKSRPLKEVSKSVSPKKSPKNSILKMADLEFQGVDLTSEAGQVTSIDWHQPHPIFVIVLVGEDELPFGIQKDLLCAKSPYYRQEFANPGENSLEHIVKLPDTTQAAFGCFQNFIYTGKVYDKELGRDIPDYHLLLDVWKLATKLQMPPLRVAVLNAMADRRMATGMIPGTKLLIQAWKETEEGSGLRLMLIGWAAEHMRGNPNQRNDFAKALPQEILSELVIVMSDLPGSNPPVTPRAYKHTLPIELLDAEQPRPGIKRPRKSAADVIMTGPEADYDVKPVIKKLARKSEPNRRVSRRVSQAFPSAEEDVDFTPEKEMEYCRGLIDRMIQGPGFWTRLVGPFKNPVNPAVDNVPNYFDVVKRPMDLNTIKTKIVGGAYASGAEFEADVRLIFQNCYEYWTQDDPIWETCQSFERYFNEQWGNRHRWTGGKSKIKTEVID